MNLFCYNDSVRCDLMSCLLLIWVVNMLCVCIIVNNSIILNIYSCLVIL